MASTQEAPAFPPPTLTAPLYPKEDLLRQFNILQDILNAGTLLIDVRRTDYEGINLCPSLRPPGLTDGSQGGQSGAA
jgi:hypothetical protein